MPDIVDGPIGDSDLAPTSTPPASTPAPSATPPSQPSATPVSTPAPLDASGTPPAATAPQPAATPPQPTQWSVRQALQEAGIDQNFSDDQQAFGYLLSQLRSVAGAYQQTQQQLALLAQQRQAAQPPAPAGAKKPWFQAPEYDPSWLSMVTQDADGNLMPKPGYPADIPAKILAYQQHQRDFLNKFTRDPIGAIWEGIQEKLEPFFEERQQRALGSYSDRTFAQNLVAQSADWMYQKNGQGQVLRSWDGRPMLTQTGQMYLEEVDRLHRLGVQDLSEQDRLARLAVAGKLAVMQQQNSAATNQQQKDALTNSNPAMRVPNAGGSITQPANPNLTPPSPNGKASLRERFTRAFDEAGISAGQVLE